MLGSFVQRAYWLVALVAALGLVLMVTSAQAVNKNPGDPFSVGIINDINRGTGLSGTTPGWQLIVVNAAPRSVAIQAAGSGTDSYGVFGDSQNYVGVLGTGPVAGVRGRTAGGNGVEGLSLGTGFFSGNGVFGSSAGGGAGVIGESMGGAGVQGQSNTGLGVVGRHTSLDGTTAGVEGDTDSTADLAIGVLGKVTSTSAGANSAGVRGINNDRTGGYGVYGSSYGSGRGVFGNSSSGIGVYGFSPALNGVRGESPTGAGVVGISDSGYAGLFDGDVYVNGGVNGGVTVIGSVNMSGNLTVSGAKWFRIDHPLDPKHKYLVHAAIESNQVLNIYSGNITTDQHGQATVRLPAYFDRINIDLRYQLTVIGQFAQAIIAKKEAGNRFAIRTDKPHVEVSWQVTARRNDAYMRAHPFHEIQNKGKTDTLPARLYRKEGAQSPRP